MCGAHGTMSGTDAARHTPCPDPCEAACCYGSRYPPTRAVLSGRHHVTPLVNLHVSTPTSCCPRRCPVLTYAMLLPSFAVTPCPVLTYAMLLPDQRHSLPDTRLDDTWGEFDHVTPSPSRGTRSTTARRPLFAVCHVRYALCHVRSGCTVVRSMLCLSYAMSRTDGGAPPLGPELAPHWPPAPSREASGAQSKL
eukprot:196445-Rhodomonas_salina.1